MWKRLAFHSVRATGEKSRPGPPETSSRLVDSPNPDQYTRNWWEGDFHSADPFSHSEFPSFHDDWWHPSQEVGVTNARPEDNN